MSRKVLIIEPPRTPAICRYRVLHAAKYLLEGDEVVRMNLNEIMGDLDPADANQLQTRSRETGLSVQELAITYWASRHEEFDMVWCAVWDEILITLAGYYQKTGARVVADVDDFFREVPRYNPAFKGWQNPRAHTVMEEHIGSADALTVSTPFLQRELGGSLCPNFIEPDEWGTEVSPDRQDGGLWNDNVVICLPSGTGRAGDYLAIERPLRSALALPNVKLLCVAWMPEWGMEFPVGKVVYADAVQFDFYMKAMPWMRPDIIISPMQQNNFNKAKSNLKWLDAAMMGSAFLGERWGELERTVDEMDTGVLASGIDEWNEKLVWLCEDAEARERIARRAKEKVLSDWTWPAVADLWTEGVFGDTTEESAYRSAQVASAGV